jgi:hypothetical protein
MPMLVIFTKIISHPITRDQLINLRNVGTNKPHDTINYPNSDS